jgi:hypothetical protein
MPAMGQSMLPPGGMVAPGQMGAGPSQQQQATQPGQAQGPRPKPKKVRIMVKSESML